MDLKEEKEETICFCYNVTRQEIEKAMQEGAVTLLDIRRVTNANTGCGGCREDVKRLLRKYIKKHHTKDTKS